MVHQHIDLGTSTLLVLDDLVKCNGRLDVGCAHNFRDEIFEQGAAQVGCRTLYSTQTGENSVDFLQAWSRGYTSFSSSVSSRKALATSVPNNASGLAGITPACFANLNASGV